MSLDTSHFENIRPPSGLDVALFVTFFEDKGAARKFEQSGTLRELIALVRDVRAPSKAALPWLKLARFGNNRDGGTALRNDANVLVIHGIEGDYDGALITLERARQVVVQAGIAAIIYTSPSHTDNAPKWRILCPTSQALPPSERARLLARVNGLFVGALAHESFTLSQAYYYGAVGEGAQHQVIAIDGRPIDLADELDAGAIYSKPPKAAPAPVNATPVRLEDGDATPYGRAALERECANITHAQDGEKHRALNKAAYSIGGLVAAGEIAEGFATASLRSALEAIRHRCDDFAHAENTLATALRDGIDNPRQPPPPRPEQARPSIFSGFNPEDLKNDSASDQGDDGAPLGQTPASGGNDPTPLWLDTSDPSTVAIPKRPWCAPGYLMRGSVSVLSGQGAGGKSSLVVALSIACARGEPMGAFKPAGPLIVVNYNTEDDQDEQRRRYSAALTAQKVPGSAIANRVIRCGPHNVGTLFERDHNTGRITPTAAMNTLRDLVQSSGADVLICDPLAELHNAEENDNTAMRAVVAAFRAMAQELGIAVLILHHDRKGNNAPGDMDRVRGASAISGAVRVMLTLTTMSQEEAEKFGIPPDQRRQHFRVDGAKSNYAPAQEAEWWRLDGYEIPNGETVAAALPWQPPSAFEGVSLATCVSILGAFRRGLDGHAFGAKGQAKGSALEMMQAPPFGLETGKAAAILAAWKREGTVREEQTDSPNSRHKRLGIVVDDVKFQEMRRHGGDD